MLPVARGTPYSFNEKKHGQAHWSPFMITLMQTHARKGRLAFLLDTIRFGMKGSAILSVESSMWGGCPSPPAKSFIQDMFVEQLCG